MPKRRRRQIDREVDAIVGLSAETFIFPIFRLFKSIATGRLAREYQYRRNLVVDVIGLIGLLVILVMLGTANLFWAGTYFFVAAGIVAGLLVLAVIIRFARIRVRSKYTVSDVSRSLERALHIMDSSAKWYNNEDEANVELVTCLKLFGLDARYRYELPNGAIADARLGNGLIEGKLSPTDTDVDRLIGQIRKYTPYGDKLHIVVYGRLNGDARKRIEHEIYNRYLGKVFLIALSNPRRLRMGNPND